jgi:hypothetical protein
MLFHHGQIDRIAHFHLMSNFRMRGALPHSPIRLHIMHRDNFTSCVCVNPSGEQRNTEQTHKTAAPHGHRSCTNALFSLPNSTTNTVSQSLRRIQRTAADCHRESEADRREADDNRSVKTVHDLYNCKTGRSTGEAVLTSLVASSFTFCTARVTNSRRNKSTKRAQCARRRQLLLLLLLLLCGSSSIVIFLNMAYKR